MMNIQEMFKQAVEVAKERSKEMVVYVMSNGKKIANANEWKKQLLEDEGYWVVTIFEQGRRIDI